MSNKDFADNYTYTSFLTTYKSKFYSIDRTIVFQNKYSPDTIYNKGDIIQDIGDDFLIRNYTSLTNNNIGNNYKTDATNWGKGDVVSFLLTEDDFNIAKKYAIDLCYWTFDLEDNKNYNLIFELYIACFLYNTAKDIQTEQITSSSIKDMSLSSNTNDFFVSNPFFNNYFGKKLYTLLQTYYSETAYGINDLVKTKMFDY